MKPAAMILLILPAAVLAADKDILPLSGLNGSGQGLCIKIKELPGRTICYSTGFLPDFPLDLIKASIRSDMFLMGFDVVNTLTATEKQRELGRRVMEAAPYLAFPELGDDPKSAPAVAYCSSSVGKEPVDPFAASAVKPTGKGRCEDLVTVYLRSKP